MNPLFKHYQKWFDERFQPNPAYPDHNIFHKWKLTSADDEESPTVPFHSGNMNTCSTWKFQSLNYVCDELCKTFQVYKRGSTINYCISWRYIPLEPCISSEHAWTKKYRSHCWACGTHLFVVLTKSSSQHCCPLIRSLALVWAAYVQAISFSSIPELSSGWSSSSCRRHLWHLCLVSAVFSMFDVWLWYRETEDCREPNCSSLSKCVSDRQAWSAQIQANPSS